MNEFIVFNQFSFKYDAQAEPTLKEINLTIAKGEKVLIVGPSGSGKSTLGQCLNGIIPNIYSGQVEGSFTIGGKDAFNLSIYDKSHLVSTVLQDPDGQFIGLTVAEDLAFALENDCVDHEQMLAKITTWSQRLDLTAFLDHRPQDLSGGQKQRVSLAGVLIDESPILLFDEPLANLDPKSGQDTIDLIDRIHQEEKATTIIIEHRLEDVLYRFVDRIVLINDGRIVFDGQPDDLLASSLLLENGIREPLYLSSLKDLGYDLSGFKRLTPLSQMTIEAATIQLPEQVVEVKDKKPLLELERICFGYSHDKPILKDVSLTIYQGERLAIVGKNGAGKSTLAKVMTKFIEASGQISYLGQDIANDSVKERASRIGYVLQNPNQMISQTMIFDEVALGLRLRGIPEDEVEQRVYEVLKTCGLYEFRKWPISALSFGQKKRVTIAAILVLNSQIILLDEPTAGQDRQHYTEIMTFLESLNQKGHTIVMITHDMQLMMEHSDRCIVIADGRLLADASPLEILGQEELLKQANLKKTSLYDLAEKLELDPIALTNYYSQKRKEDLCRID
ncbi:ABC transporter ATP-binding protein [Streptococcus saliviloxodontae]|uniref:Energy-coupling factor transport system ATP-binding protein n=1 Tax=Streptococcus saliviloxodontae TaxID=1349416 RepID=A0ABS2PN43_9STRE|nr:ABC transporter ATP-binding protein [Streptococcus saliviloxodontae]MBM7636855.1 energy-coupling factor transport system ATP-binding protein [Streptococcus saliviloxodontae]